MDRWPKAGYASVKKCNTYGSRCPKVKKLGLFEVSYIGLPIVYAQDAYLQATAMCLHDVVESETPFPITWFAQQPHHNPGRANGMVSISKRPMGHTFLHYTALVSSRSVDLKLTRGFSETKRYDLKPTCRAT